MKTNDIDLDDLDIDVTRLDDEWSKQPKLYFHAAELQADVAARVDRLRSLVKVAEAEVRALVVADTDKYDAGKGTAPDITAAVIRAMANKKVVTNLRKAEHRLDIVKAFVGALDQKKRALESHVNLFVHNYNSAPREPKGGHDAVGNMKDQRRARRGTEPPKKKGK